MIFYILIKLADAGDHKVIFDARTVYKACFSLVL